MTNAAATPNQATTNAAPYPPPSSWTSLLLAKAMNENAEKAFNAPVRVQKSKQKQQKKKKKKKKTRLFLRDNDLNCEENSPLMTYSYR